MLFKLCVLCYQTLFQFSTFFFFLYILIKIYIIYVINGQALCHFTATLKHFFLYRCTMCHLLFVPCACFCRREPEALTQFFSKSLSTTHWDPTHTADIHTPLQLLCINPSFALNEINIKLNWSCDFLEQHVSVVCKQSYLCIVEVSWHGRITEKVNRKAQHWNPSSAWV